MNFPLRATVTFAIVLIATLLSVQLSLSEDSNDSAKPSSKKAVESVEPNPEPFTNDYVIRLCKNVQDDDLVITKLRYAKKANFRLEGEDIALLKNAGVSSKVITAMIEWSPPSSIGQRPRAIDTPSGQQIITYSDVALVAQEGAFHLTGIAGAESHVDFGIWYHALYWDYPDVKASIRTNDHSPIIKVTSVDNPTNRYFLVKLEVDEDDEKRSLKIGNSKLASSSNYGLPDKDQQVHFDATKEETGLWTLRPHKTLARGEYGLWVQANHELYEFGVD